MNYKNNKGFTLIELVVVFAIIGFLATIVVIALVDARNKARDSRRLADMVTIKKALNMYFNEYKEYPAGDYDNCFTSEWDHGPCSENDFLSKLRDGGFLPQGVPVDPSGGDGSGSYGYVYHLYNAGDEGCNPSQGKFYVLGVRNMQTVPEGGISAQSPGWACSGRNWETELEWVTGEYEK